MRVLVAAASRHGATEEIARHIADILATRGLEVTVAPPQEVSDPWQYQAVVLGSAIYAGHWLNESKQLAQLLIDRPGPAVWLFSSGGLGDPPMPGTDPVEVPDLMLMMAAREHRLFAGKLDRSLLNLGERAIVRMVKAPDGDFRSWDEISVWGEEIALQLEMVAAST